MLPSTTAGVDGTETSEELNRVSGLLTSQSEVCVITTCDLRHFASKFMWIGYKDVLTQLSPLIANFHFPLLLFFDALTCYCGRRRHPAGIETPSSAS